VTAARQHLIQFNNSFIIIRHQAVVTHNYDQAVVKAQKKGQQKDLPLNLLVPGLLRCRLIAPRYSSYPFLILSCQRDLLSPSSNPIVLRIPSAQSSVISLPVSVASCQPARTRYLSLGCQRCNAARSPTSHCQLNVESYSHFKWDNGETAARPKRLAGPGRKSRKCISVETIAITEKFCR